MDIQSYVDFQNVLKTVWSSYMGWRDCDYCKRSDRLEIVNPEQQLDYYEERNVSKNEDNDHVDYSPTINLFKSLVDKTPLIHVFDVNNGSLIEGYTLKTKMNSSPYGDLTTGETKVDTSVRCANEISGKDLTLTENGVKALEQVKKEAEQILKRPVNVRVNKLNKYKRGCFFSDHVDTPHEGLLATGIIMLPYAYKGGSLVVTSNEKKEKWNPNDSYGYNAVIMFGNHTHKVTPVKSGNRVTLTLYIEAAGPVSPTETKSDIVKQIASTLPKKTGILAVNQYSKWEAERCELRGIDLELQEALGARAIPVLVLHSEQRDVSYGGDYGDELYEYVVPFNYDIMRTWIGEEPEPMPSWNLKGWKVVATSRNYFTVYSDHIQGIEHTGNESQPEQQDGMYYSVLLC